MNKTLIFSTGLFCLFFNANASLDGVIIPNIGWHNAKIKQPTHAKDELTNLEKTIYTIEQKYGIPQGLLYAIALTESGRTDKNTKKFTTWPWTVNANGKAYYLKSKQDAIQKVKELQDMGITLIDVGCMQINLVHHAKAFKSLNEAFTPEKNIEYAAQLLSSLHSQKKSWEKAARYYHSATELLNNRYYCSVMKNYQKVLKMPKPPQHEDKVMHYLCKNNVKVSHYLCKNETSQPLQRSKPQAESFDQCVQNTSSIDDAISRRLQALGKMVLARNSRY